MLANRHGFTIDRVGAPIVMSDGLFGDQEVELPIDDRETKKVSLAAELVNTDSIFVVSHVTGHMLTGVGAAIKNMAMGLTSRKGKLHLHSQTELQVKKEKCVLCKKCMHNCPIDCIEVLDGRAHIDEGRCIGCGECLTMCRFSAIEFDFEKSSGITHTLMAEHAAAIMKNKKGKIFFFNVMVNITKGCDCCGEAQKKAIQDVGILASSDPIAIDQASIDLSRITDKLDGYPPPYTQLEYGERLGIGSTDYELIQIEA